MTDTKIERGSSGLSLQVVSEMTGYAPSDIALISKTVAVGASLTELAIFLHSCRQLGLDPLLRQAYWIRRKQKDGTQRGALQVGIDGFRAIAERSGTYAGAESIEYRGQLAWKYKGEDVSVPELARATIWKVVAGHKSAFVGEAHWIEFAPSEGNAAMWAKMPRHMLGKCAEAQALRRAFPAQLGPLELDDDQGAVSVTEAPEHAPRAAEQKRLAQRHAEIYDHAYDLPEANAPEVEEEPDDD
jgi:phage recombination protein Bet